MRHSILYKKYSSAETLVISFVGMKQQEVSVKPHVIVVLHPDAEVLDEVMVVAYGTAKKSSLQDLHPTSTTRNWNFDRSQTCPKDLKDRQQVC